MYWELLLTFSELINLHPSSSSVKSHNNITLHYITLHYILIKKRRIVPLNVYIALKNARYLCYRGFIFLLGWKLL